MINIKDFKDFTQEENDQGTFVYLYGQAKDMDTAKKYFKQFSQGSDIESEEKYMEEGAKLVGLEISIEIDRDTNEITLFTFSPVSYDEEQDYMSSFDPMDIHVYDDADVLAFVKAACTEPTLLKAVEEVLSAEEIER